MRNLSALPVLLLLVLSASCGSQTSQSQSQSPAATAPPPAPPTTQETNVTSEKVAAPAVAPVVEPATVPPVPTKPLAKSPAQAPEPIPTPLPATVVPESPVVSESPVPMTPPVVDPAPVEPPTLAPPVPVAPLPAPDLKLVPPVVFQASPVTLKTASLPSGTVVRYTLDGSDPANGKPWPAAGVAVNQTGRIRVWAAQVGGEAATAEVSVTIGEVWVQPGSTGDGSWTRPLGTLDEGVAKAHTLGVSRLRLTAGTFATKTELSGTWDLSGGWKGPGEVEGTTILSGSKQSGSTQKEPAYTLKVAPNAKVTLSALEVRSPNSSFGAALLVEVDSTVEVNRCRLIGGNGLYGYGLKASGAASVSAVDSWFYGGDGGSSFALSAEKTKVKVVRSTLDAGSGDAVSYGVNLTLSSLTLVSSVVWGGSANSSYGVGLYSSPGSSILASTILGGRGSSAWALYLSESEPEIAGCLIGSQGKSKSYGIFANYGNSLPRSLRSNAFFGSSSGAFSGAALGVISSQPSAAGAFLDSQGNPLSGQKANLKGDVALGPGPDYRTLASSSAVVLKGSEALPGDASLDRAGRQRGASPAFGAWTISP